MRNLRARVWVVQRQREINEGKSPSGRDDVRWSCDYIGGG